MVIMIGGKWLRVPTQLLTCEQLTRADIAVWCYIADRIGDETAPVARAAIAAACEISDSSVKRAVRKLIGLHYLHAQERPGAPTVYRQTLLEPKKRSSSKQRPQEREDGTPIEAYMQLMNAFDLDPTNEGKEVI